MSTFTTHALNAMLEAITADGVWVALYTATPTEAGGGTEVSGAGYARQAVTLATVANGATSNSAEVVFTPSGGGYGTVVAAGLCSAVSAGYLYAFDTITPEGNDEAPVKIPAGSLTLTVEDAS